MSVPDRRWKVSLALLVAGYAALLAAWAVGNPVGRAPDEPAHYIRALAAGTGDIHGAPVTVAAGSFPPVQARWVQQITRTFVMPQRLAIDQTPPCPLGNPAVSAACQRRWPSPGASTQPTNVGSYQPYVYVPEGALMRTAPSRWTAFVFGRAFVAAASLALLVLAAAVLWRGPSRGPGPHPLLVLGALLAVTPMAVFLASTLNPSGVEVAAGVACAAGLVSLARQTGDASAPRGAWLAFGAGGVVLAAARSLGPYFAAVLIGVIVLLVGVGRARDAVRAAPRAATIALGCVAGAAVLNLWWEVTYQPHLAWTHVLDHATLAKLPRFGEELVGKFGWLEYRLPWPFYALWGLLVLAIAVTALVVGTWKHRAILLAFIVGCLGLAVAFNSVLPTQTGYDFQGRYLLPLVVATPLVAAEIVRRNRPLTGRVLAGGAVAVGVLVAVLQFSGWYLNARRYAVGTSGPRWFASHAQWSPTWGWPIWIAVAAGGSLCLAVSVAVAVGPVLFSGALFEREPARAVPAQP
jgi:hypothetical protein